MNFFLKKETERLKQSISSLRTDILIIFITIPLLSTLSWYFASPDFYHYIFNSNLLSPNIFNDLKPILFWFGGDVLLFFLIPASIILFLFKQKLSGYGFCLGEKKTGIKYFLFSLIIILPIVLIVSFSSEFTSVYPILKSAKTNWFVFIIFELLLFLYVVSWEFMWRGYVIFGLEKEFGFYAVLIQAIPFVILHNGKPFPETLGAIFGGIFLGYLALRTRSFLYGVFIHFSLISFLDLISVLKYRLSENFEIF